MHPCDHHGLQNNQCRLHRLVGVQGAVLPGDGALLCWFFGVNVAVVSAQACLVLVVRSYLEVNLTKPNVFDMMRVKAGPNHRWKSGVVVLLEGDSGLGRSDLGQCIGFGRVKSCGSRVATLPKSS